jgi:hypothetical protein
MLKMMSMTMGSLWLLTLCVSRIYVFHNAYIHHKQVIEDERWLRAQCHDAVFYSNLKQHAGDLCTQVHENAQRSTLLVALHETLAAASMCGTVSCWDIFVYVQAGGLSLACTLSVVVVFLVLLVIPAINTVLRATADMGYFAECANPCIERGSRPFGVPAVYDQDCTLWKKRV